MPTLHSSSKVVLSGPLLTSYPLRWREGGVQVSTHRSSLLSTTVEEGVGGVVQLST